MSNSTATRAPIDSVKKFAVVAAIGCMTAGAQGYADEGGEQSNRSNERGTSVQAADIHSRAPFEFALIGDTRYNDEGSAHFGPMREEINQDRKLK